MLLPVTLTLLLPLAAQAAEPIVLDRVAAALDGEALLLSAVWERAAVLRTGPAPAAGAPLDDEERALLERALEGLLLERLVAAEAREHGLAVGPEEVEGALDAVAAQNGLDRPGLLAALPAQGLDEARYRALLAQQLLHTKLVQVRLGHRPRPPIAEDAAAWQPLVEAEERALAAQLTEPGRVERLLVGGAAARAPGDLDCPGLPAATFRLERAPAPWPEGVLARVTVVSLDPLHAALARMRVAARPGLPLTPAVVASDLASLWAQGDAAGAWAEVRAGAAGLELTYHLRPRPLFEGLTLAAPEGLGQAEAREALGLSPPAPLAPSAVRDASRALRALLRRRGYLEAELAWSHRLRPAGLSLPDGVTLRLEVRPGPRYHLGPLRFTGNARLTDEELRACIGAEPMDLAWSRPDMTAVLLQACYYDRGMITARVEAPAPSTFEAGRAIAVTVRVEEGEVFRLGELRFAGTLAAPEADYRAALGVEPGAIFSRSALQAGLERVDALHARRGRTGLRVEPRTEIDAGARLVHLTLEVAGP